MIWVSVSFCDQHKYTYWNYIELLNQQMYTMYYNWKSFIGASLRATISLFLVHSVLIFLISPDLGNVSCDPPKDNITLAGIEYDKYYVIPAKSKHTATIIFVNGFRDTEFYWGHILMRVQDPHVKILCPGVDFVIPTLKNKEKFAFWIADRRMKNHSEFPEDVEGIRGGSAHLHQLIDAEIKQGIPSERIILGGTDQGGVIALHCGLTCGHKLGGLIGLSTWLPFRNHTQSEYGNTLNKDIPIFLSNSIPDKNLSKLYEYDTDSRLKTITNNLISNLYLKSIKFEKQFEDMKEFIDKRIGPPQI